MHTTSVSLLERLRMPSDADAWERFVRLYTPLLMYWSRRLGLQDHDAADLVQDVLMVLVRKLPEFQYQSDRTFRGWMRTVLMNKWRDRPQFTTPDGRDFKIEPWAQPENEQLEEREFRLYVIGRAMKLMAADFETATWRACWETVVGDRPAVDVASELNITINAVYLAKSRVLGRLRRELEGLVDLK